MKGLDYLRMSFGNVDAKLPPLKEVKPQHPLGKFSDYEDALDELCINALAKLTPEQREIIFRRCSRNIRSWEKMKHLHAFFGVGGHGNLHFLLLVLCELFLHSSLRYNK